MKGSEQGIKKTCCVEYGSDMASCTDCQHLKNCPVVDENKLVSGYYCDSWTLAADSEVKARDQIIQALGPWALKFENPRLRNEKSAKSKIRRRHKNG